MTKKGWIISAVAVLAVGVVAGVVLVLLPKGGDAKEADKVSQTSPTQQTESVPAGKELTQENASLLETALNSSSKTEQEKALVPEIRSGEWSSEAVVPDGAKLTIDRESFVVDAQHDQLGTVRARVTGSVQGEFTFRLMLVDGTWLVLQTEQTH